MIHDERSKKPTFDEIEEWLVDGSLEFSSAKLIERLKNTGRSGLKVLLAEDCQDTAIVISALLEDRGLEVFWVPDGPECISKALEAEQANKSFDVVLVDIKLPTINGFDVAKTLRARGYEGILLAITANPSLALRNESVINGCDGFLAKAGISHTLFSAIDGIKAAQNSSVFS